MVDFAKVESIKAKIATFLPTCGAKIESLNAQDRKDLEKLLKDFYKKKGIFLEDSFEIPPTLLAVFVYEKIAKILQNDNPYKALKEKSITQARGIKESLLAQIPQKSDLQKLDFGICCAVLGNVMDYGAQESFDIKVELKRLHNFSFAFFEIESFLKKLKDSKKLLYIGDNAGENELDEILIQVCKEINPKLEITYFTRGVDIINDITMQDLKESDSKLFSLYNVVNSGVLSPGFIESLASGEAQEIYQNADLILAKGMGNFESMEAKKDSRVYFLFKIKCDVVASFLGKNLGDFVFKNNI